MPFWRKCILSPDTTVACSNCKKKVSVPWAAVFAAVPIALGIVAAVSLGNRFSCADARRRKGREQVHAADVRDARG